ncbi:hypothetical protein NDU88_000995 [Pleurodeles waltl]|uniref:Uncharacterized protein n=1 Tax=Pleurodeles waltl TaxID=8319 RepID=A0AAV7KNE4_PLEWA|nr:hypothetical protein NDU88_000995 [Pleurodeles waltl]
MGSFRCLIATARLVRAHPAGRAPEFVRLTDAAGVDSRAFSRLAREQRALLAASGAVRCHSCASSSASLAVSLSPRGHQLDANRGRYLPSTRRASLSLEQSPAEAAPCP